MNKNKAKLLIIFVLSAILVISSQAFAQTTSAPVPSPTTPDANSFFNTAFLQNIVVAVLSAVLAFVGGYALAGIGKKQGKGKKLSYGLSIENGLVQIEKNIS